MNVETIWLPSDIHCFDTQNGDKRHKENIEWNCRRYPFGFKGTKQGVFFDLSIHLSAISRERKLMLKTKTLMLIALKGANRWHNGDR